MLIRFLPELIFALALSLLAAKAHAQEVAANEFRCETSIFYLNKLHSFDGPGSTEPEIISKDLKLSTSPRLVATLSGVNFLAAIDNVEHPTLLTLYKQIDNGLTKISDTDSPYRGIASDDVFDTCEKPGANQDTCAFDASTMSSVYCYRLN
jgi:hypothetical protein